MRHVLFGDFWVASQSNLSLLAVYASFLTLEANFVGFRLGFARLVYFAKTDKLFASTPVSCEKLWLFYEIS